MTTLLLGAQGQLGWELGSSLAPLGRVITLGRHEADFARLDDLKALVEKIKPRCIINAAAHTKVDQAETEPELARRINAEAPALLANLAKEMGAWLVHYSTDYVFDGRKEGPYTEEDQPNPLNIYGRSKLEGDLGVMNSGCRHLIFRTSWVFAGHGRNFPLAILELTGKEKELSVVNDQFGSPTSVELIANATSLALSRAMTSAEDLSGLYNLVSSGYTNWHSYAQYVVQKASELGWQLLAKAENIKTKSTDESGRAAKRPANSRLSTAKFAETFKLSLPPWQYYVDRLIWSWARMRKPEHAPQHILGRRYISSWNPHEKFRK